jgi:hypothetical protein
MNAPRAVVDMLEERNRQRFLVRREAERRRGVTPVASRRPIAGRAGHSSVTPHPHLPTPWLAITVVASLGVMFLLAVAGAYSLIRAVFGQ